MNNHLSRIYNYQNHLIFCGVKGQIVAQNYSLNFDFVFDSNCFYLINYKTRFVLASNFSFFDNLRFVNSFVSKKLNLIGIGFRCWTITEENKKYLVMRTSLSKDSLFHIPKSIDVYCLTSTSIHVKGLCHISVNNFISNLKNIKEPNFYKKKGVFLENEHLILKVGKKN